MIRFLPILFFAVLAHGQAVPYFVVPLAAATDYIRANVLLTFEGSDGTAADATWLNANDIGTTIPGAWTVDGANPTNTTLYKSTMARTYRVDGTNFYTGGSTASCCFTHDSDNWIEFQWPEGSRTNKIIQVRFDWFATVEEPDPEDAWYSYLTLGHDNVTASEWGVFQMRDWEWTAHTTGSDDPKSGIHRLTWYHVVVDDKATNGVNTNVVTATVYGTDGTQIGSSVSVGISQNSGGIRTFQLGNITPHGGYPTGAVMCIDNLAIIWDTNEVVSPPPGDCTLLAQQTTDNDFWSGTPLAQAFTNATEMEVCKFVAKLSTQGGVSTDVTAGWWSTPSGAGTQYGTDSASVSVTSATAANKDFTWASNPTVPSGVVYLRLSAAASFRWRSSSTSTYAGGVAFVGASEKTGKDYVFELHTIP